MCPFGSMGRIVYNSLSYLCRYALGQTSFRADLSFFGWGSHHIYDALSHVAGDLGLELP